MSYRLIIEMFIGSLLGNLMWDRIKVAVQQKYLKSYKHSWVCPAVSCYTTFKTTDRKDIEFLVTNHMEDFHNTTGYIYKESE